MKQTSSDEFLDRINHSQSLSPSRETVTQFDWTLKNNESAELAKK